MNRILKSAVLSAALAATTLTVLAPAEAHDRWHGHRHSHGGGGGELLAAGVLGLAVGAIVGGALDDEPIYRPVYESSRDPIVRPRPTRPYVAAPIEYQASLEPWTPEWYDFCEGTYRSFDPSTGTYVGYDGEEHFCIAN